MSESDSPSAASAEFGDIHHAVINALKQQLLIVLINRLGGSVDIPVSEVDNTGGWLLGMWLEQPEITGDKPADTKIGGVFHFETRKKQ